jgi:hypothetical protein
MRESLTSDDLQAIDAYWRATNYLSESGPSSTAHEPINPPSDPDGRRSYCRRKIGQVPLRQQRLGRASAGEMPFLGALSRCASVVNIFFT